MKFIRTLLNCCAGFQFYRSLLPLHPLESIRFLAGVVLLVVVIQITTFLPVIWRWMDRGAEWVQRNLPRFEIVDGHAHYDAAKPFVYSNQIIRITLDTSGATNDPPYTTPYGLFIGRDRIEYGVAYGDKDGGLKSPHKSMLMLKDCPDGTVDGDYIRALRTAFMWRLAPLAIVFGFFLWLLLVLIQAYIFTLVISLAESTTLRRFGFNEFFNIAAHACAPAAIVVTTLIVSRLAHFDILLLAFLTTYFIYVMGATAACRRDGQEEEKDSDGMA